MRCPVGRRRLKNWKLTKTRAMTAVNISLARRVASQRSSTQIAIVREKKILSLHRLR